MTHKDTTPEPEDVSCPKCDVGHLRYVSRAKWVCDTCDTDNSLYYVLLCEASREVSDV